MAPAPRQGFDPRSILACLQGEEVQHVLIGGLARVLRGSDEVTAGVDICPSLQAANLDRLELTLTQLGAHRLDGIEMLLAVEIQRTDSVVELSTRFGELKLVPVPAGAPRGYDALRPGATAEHLGKGLRTDVAATVDLIAMSAALRRADDLERFPRLRRLLELEADPARLVAPPRPARSRPGAALTGELSYFERTRRGGPGAAPGVGR